MNANRISYAIIAFFIILCSSIIVFGIVFYDKLAVLGWAVHVFCFVLPGLGIVFFASLLGLKKQTRLNILMSIVSIVLAVYLAEGILTLITPAAAGASVDARTYADIVTELAQKGDSAALNIVGASFLGNNKPGRPEQPFLPLGGVADARVVLCNEVGQWVTYRSDEHGFHNPPGLYDQESLQIAAIGDSFTQGWCSQSGQSIVGLIRKSYPNTLNLGMSRNGPLLELASFMEFAAPFKPEITLWFYYEGNDLTELTQELQDGILQRYLSEQDFSQNLISRREEVQAFLRQYSTAKLQEIMHAAQTAGFADTLWYYRKHSLFKFITLSQLSGRLHLFPSPVEASRTIDPSSFAQILRKAQEKIESWQGRLYFVYLCQKSRLSRLGEPNPYRRQVLDIVRNLAIPLIDGCEIFQSEANPLALYQGHFTDKGNALIAGAVIDALAKSDSPR